MAWVSKNPIFFLQINLFSFCARIEPKLSKLQKTVKIDKRSSKKPCFLIVFRIFSILGSILAQKTTKSKYLSIVPFICHPGHPWSCESSGVITRDEFELEFSGSSEPELWRFRAEPSRAGALQFSSWNRAEIFLRSTIKFPNLYQYHDYNQF